jgi:hypothetical protein
MTGEAQRPAPAGSDGDVIRPVSYHPAAPTKATRWPLSPLQLALLALLAAVVFALWFLFTAQSVRLLTDPAAAQTAVSGGLRLRLGEVWLLRTGGYRLRAEAPGHYPLEAEFEVGTAANQVHRFALVRLPGQVTFTSDPPGATVVLNGQTLGITPTEPQAVAAGPLTVALTRERYQPLELSADIEGMERPQVVHGALLPNWADVSITTTPAGAEIFIDDEPTGAKTPAVVEVLAGEREIRLKAPGHRSHRQRILVDALEQVELAPVSLVRADSLLTVRSNPPGAGITLNGRFQGESPRGTGGAVRRALPRAGVPFRLCTGRAQRRAGLRRRADPALRPRALTGTLIVQAQPEAARLYVNGRDLGPANQTLTLPTEPHRVEIRLPGYADYAPT